MMRRVSWIRFLLYSASVWNDNMLALCDIFSCFIFYSNTQTLVIFYGDIYVLYYCMIAVEELNCKLKR